MQCVGEVMHVALQHLADSEGVDYSMQAACLQQREASCTRLTITLHQQLTGLKGIAIGLAVACNKSML